MAIFQAKKAILKKFFAENKAYIELINILGIYWKNPKNG